MCAAPPLAGPPKLDQDALVLYTKQVESSLQGKAEKVAKKVRNGRKLVSWMIGCQCCAQVMPPLDPSILVDHIKAQGRRERKNPGSDGGGSSLWTLGPHERLLKMSLQKEQVQLRKDTPLRVKTNKPKPWLLSVRWAMSFSVLNWASCTHTRGCPLVVALLIRLACPAHPH